jgi:large subunit ribosomal protein L17
VAQQAVGEAERARGSRFASRAGGASAAGEVTADALEPGLVDEGVTTGPGGDTSPAVVNGAEGLEDAQEIVADVFNPDGERQDDADVTPEPTAENLAVVDDPGLSPDVAAAAAAEVEAAELGDAATAGTHAPGGEPEVDPK